MTEDIFEDYVGRMSWTILETAFLVAGIKPVDDMPCLETKGSIQAKVYRDLKDYLETEEGTKIRFSGSRQRTIAGKRVRPREALVWLQQKRDFDLPPPLEDLVNAVVSEEKPFEGRERDTYERILRLFVMYFSSQFQDRYRKPNGEPNFSTIADKLVEMADPDHGYPKPGTIRRKLSSAYKNSPD